MLVTVVLTALSAFAATAVARAIFRLHLAQGRKPIACDVCMSVWTSAAALAGAFLAGRLSWPDALVFWPPSAGLTLLLLSWYGAQVPATAPGLFRLPPDA